MPFADVLQSFGDAITGTDRAAAERKGQLERAHIDETEAQTEAAMSLARDRRLDAEKKERQRAAEDALRQHERELNDPDKVSGIDVMTSGLGAEYSGLQAGRQHAIENQQHQIIGGGIPGMGDATEDQRINAMESLAPGQALATRRPRSSDPLEITIDPDTGKTIYTPRRDAAGAQVGARPSTAAGNQHTGPLRTADSAMIYRQSAGIFGGTYDPTTGRFSGMNRQAAEQMQRLASRASVIFAQGQVDHATAVDQALHEMQEAAKTGGEIPPQFGTDTAPGAGAGAVPTATNPQTGEKVKYVNGQWVPAQ